MDFYRRDLPHWHPDDVAIFLTWCLHGACAHFTKPTQAGMPVPQSQGREFVRFDRALDKDDAGPKWLREPAIAQCVMDALRFGERTLHLYKLAAFCVMPNHVHAVVEPLEAVSKITKSIKGFTARTANELLRRTGEPFWQSETYDHWIRNGREWERIIAYTEDNPVKAGLAQTPEEWPWSSAAGRCS